MKLTANKNLGQHFLINQHIIQKIVRSFTTIETNAAIEVGPGIGALTFELLKIDPNLFAIEKDDRFTTLLSPHFKENHLFHIDALKFDWSNFLKINNLTNKEIGLISNLPYNVATPLIIQFMKIQEIKKLTLMMQKEVGEKFHYFNNKKNQMNSLLSLSQNYFETEVIAIVPPSAFKPAPKVDSIVLSFIRRESPLIPLSEFLEWEKFLRALFSQKRKQINHQLKSLIQAEDSRKKILSDLAISPMARAESLSLPDIQNLYKTIRSLKV